MWSMEVKNSLSVIFKESLTMLQPWVWFIEALHHRCMFWAVCSVSAAIDQLSCSIQEPLLQKIKQNSI